jgi:hypothetical protein
MVKRHKMLKRKFDCTPDKRKSVYFNPNFFVDSSLIEISKSTEGRS